MRDDDQLFALGEERGDGGADVGGVGLDERVRGRVGGKEGANRGVADAEGGVAAALEGGSEFVVGVGKVPAAGDEDDCGFGGHFF